MAGAETDAAAARDFWRKWRRFMRWRERHGPPASVVQTPSGSIGPRLVPVDQACLLIVPKLCGVRSTVLSFTLIRDVSPGADLRPPSRFMRTTDQQDRCFASLIASPFYDLVEHIGPKGTNQPLLISTVHDSPLIVVGILDLRDTGRRRKAEVHSKSLLLGGSGPCFSVLSTRCL